MAKGPLHCKVNKITKPFKAGKGYLKVQHCQKVPKGQRLEKDIERSKVGKRYLNVRGSNIIHSRLAKGT